ncbi:uncharacterized protein LOC132548156 [Ylistrum balloti]|uniref:uncharacterized protein LOC132548156 n=1 Tax=Ylistrum balloti TaxID=509963 RepID=UPI002905CC25|nr:uncharacterized protein LOC132548156 [Ylistrum balloti]
MAIICLLLVVFQLSDVHAAYDINRHADRSVLKDNIEYGTDGFGQQTLTDIEKRLSALESDNHLLKNENHQLQTENINLRQDVQTLKKENQDIQKQFLRLEIETHGFMKVIENIDATVGSLERERENSNYDKAMPKSNLQEPIVSSRPEKSSLSNISKSIPTDVDQMPHIPVELNANLEPKDPNNMSDIKPSSQDQEGYRNPLLAVQREISKDLRVRVPTTGVAFHTRLSSSISDILDNQPIIMSNVLTNEGAGYDTSTGHFTCPVSGVYAFFVTAVSIHDKSIELQLVKNGVGIGNLVNGNTVYWGSSSNVVIVSAQERDHIWLQVNGHFHDDGVLLDGYFTTFSGFLLFRN